jgi:hypothetical protein
MQVDLSGQKFVFPQNCACCGGPPETTFTASASRSRGKKVVHTTTKSWEFPYCKKCCEHVAAAKGAVAATTFIVLAAVIVALYVAIAWEQGAIGLLLGAGGLACSGGINSRLMSKAKALCSAGCVTVKPAVSYLGWQGSCHMFGINSPAYARAFMLANQNKLVNVRPEVWKWLNSDRHLIDNQQAQSPKRYMT